jgi:hypothetical protein
VAPRWRGRNSGDKLRVKKFRVEEFRIAKFREKNPAALALAGSNSGPAAMPGRISVPAYWQT